MSFDARLENGDLVINEDIEILEDTDKLLQDSIKLLLTPLGSWIFDPQYGTKLSIDLIGEALPSWISEQNLSSLVIAAFEHYKDIQKAQVASGQFLSDAERLASVANVEVFRDRSDPRQFNTFITLVTRNGAVVTHRFKFDPSVGLDTGTTSITEISSF